MLEKKKTYTTTIIKQKKEKNELYTICISQVL